MLASCCLPLAGSAQDLDSPPWFLEAINAPIDLQPENSRTSLVIAIVDDGMYTTHQDLADFIWTNPREIAANRIDDDGNGFVDDVHGWDVSDRDNDVAAPDDRDDLFHGTHLGGIISRIAKHAYGDNAARYIRLLPVKSLPDDAPYPAIIDGYQGIDYAISAGADIILVAWGIGTSTREEERLINEALDRGIILVASGGNLPEEREQFPAAFPGVIAVAATDREARKVPNSNYGEFIDLAAPGEAIRSASIESDNAYVERDGSSYAAAMVAASMAVLKLQYPDFSKDQLLACLKSSSDPIAESNANLSGKTGAGRLNLSQAVQCELLNQEPADLNLLSETEGYLHVSGRRGDAVNWLIRPQGEFNGMRFNPVHDKSTRLTGTLELRPNTADGLLQSYALEALPESIYLPASEVNVAFIPDRRRRMDWLMEYQVDTIDFSSLYCADTVQLHEEGFLEDGSADGDYAAASDCKWQITAPEGKVVRFDFELLDTEAYVDQLYFFHGTGTQQTNQLATYSGTELPANYVSLTSPGNKVLLWFVTDGQNQGRGWRLQYRFVDP